MHTDNKKRRSFVALLFAAGDVRRYVKKVKSEFIHINLSSKYK